MLHVLRQSRPKAEKTPARVAPVVKIVFWAVLVSVEGWIFFVVLARDGRVEDPLVVVRSIREKARPPEPQTEQRQPPPCLRVEYGMRQA